MTKHIVNKDSIFIPEGTIEDFKRPNHPDFMVSSELKKFKFNGIRSNAITNSAEIWVEGEMVKSVSIEDFNRDPLAMNKALEEVFALERALPDTPDVREAVKKGWL